MSNDLKSKNHVSEDEEEEELDNEMVLNSRSAQQCLNESKRKLQDLKKNFKIDFKSEEKQYNNKILKKNKLTLQNKKKSHLFLNVFLFFYLL